MAPPFLTGLYGLLIGAAPYMALGCFVAAAVSFRSGGGLNFEFGGGFTKWIFWGMVFLSLPAIPTVLTAAGIPLRNPRNILDIEPISFRLAGIGPKLHEQLSRKPSGSCRWRRPGAQGAARQRGGQFAHPLAGVCLTCSLRAGSLDDGTVLEPVLGPVRRGRRADESCELVWK